MDASFVHNARGGNFAMKFSRDESIQNSHPILVSYSFDLFNLFLSQRRTFQGAICGDLFSFQLNLTH